MMGCDYFPFSSWMGGGFVGGIFSIFLWGLIIVVFVFLTIKLVGSIKSTETIQYRDRIDSVGILKMRYAKGEINRDEYVKLRDILLQS